jgi:hypothetical protein
MVRAGLRSTARAYAGTSVYINQTPLYNTPNGTACFGFPRDFSILAGGATLLKAKQ